MSKMNLASNSTPPRLDTYEEDSVKVSYQRKHGYFQKIQLNVTMQTLKKVL